MYKTLKPGTFLLLTKRTTSFTRTGWTHADKTALPITEM